MKVRVHVRHGAGVTVSASGRGIVVGGLLVVSGTQPAVGKTFVSLRLSASLAAQLKKPVCLLDLDPGDSQAAKFLGVAVARSLFELVPLLKRGTAPAALPFEKVSATHSSGIHLLAGALPGRSPSPSDLQSLPAICEGLLSRYPWVIVDGGRAFSELVLPICRVAQGLVLVTTPELVRSYQTKWALAMLEGLGLSLRSAKVLLNRAQPLASGEAHDLQAELPCEIVAYLPVVSPESGPSRTLSVVALAADDPVMRLAGRLVAGSIEWGPRGMQPRVDRADAALWSARMHAMTFVPLRDEVTDPVAIVKRRVHTQLLEMPDLKDPELASPTSQRHWLALRRNIEQLVAGLLARESEPLVALPDVRARLVKEITDEALGLGPLEDLLEDPDVTDILVNGKDQVYVERRGRLELTAKQFVTTNQLRAVMERILAPVGRRVDESSPMVDARLPDGSRVNVVIHPLALRGPIISIRKFSRIRYTQDDLIQLGSLTPAMARLLHACVRARKNMIISGGAGSGKTTLMNILAAAIPAGQRIITIEDAAEFKLSQTHWVSLEARPPNIEGKGAVTIRELFRNALRMRADRILIGECRGAETLDMLQAMNTGHDGSLTTMHANSPRDVIARLDSMVLMSDIELPVRAVREMVASAVHVIMHTEKLADGSRKITDIAEITGMGPEGDILFQDLFTFRQTGLGPEGKVLGTFEPAGRLPMCWKDLVATGVGIDESMLGIGKGETAGAETGR